MNEKKKTWARNPQFIMILIIATLIYCSMQMLNVILPKYANEMGSTIQEVGMLSGIFAMCALFMRPISGQVVDNEKKLVLLRVVLIFQMIGVGGLAIFNQYEMLLIFRGLSGLSWGVGSTLCMTIATNCFAEKNMATGIGIYGLGQTLAQTIGPLIALSFSDVYGYQWLYILNTVMMVFCIMLTLFLKVEDNHTHKRKYSINLKDMFCISALPPAALTMCGMIAKASIAAFLVIYAGILDVSNISIFFSVQAIVIFISRPLIAKYSDKVGVLKVLIPCEILAVAGLIMVAFSTNLTMFLFAAVLTGLSAAGEQPILMAECVRSADVSKRGSASNTNYIGTDLGIFLGSNFAGLMVAYLGYRNMFLLSTIPLIVCTIVYMYIFKKKMRTREA